MIIIRTIYKFFNFWIQIAGSVLDYYRSVYRQDLSHDYMAKSKWLQKWCQRTLRAMNVHYTVEGTIPQHGMLASTHVSYVDVLIIGAVTPSVFVAKSQVRKWPIVGFVTNLAGTLYVSREHKGDVRRIVDEFKPYINAGILAVVFPEGTSTDSHTVRPFYSSLFEPAVQGNFPVTSAWVGYTVKPPFKSETHVCFWGDMGFAPHLIRLLSTTGVEAKLIFGQTIEHPTDRKQIANAMHQDALNIAAQQGRITTPANP